MVCHRAKLTKSWVWRPSIYWFSDFDNIVLKMAGRSAKVPKFGQQRQVLSLYRVLLTVLLTVFKVLFFHHVIPGFIRCIFDFRQSFISKTVCRGVKRTKIWACGVSTFGQLKGLRSVWGHSVHFWFRQPCISKEKKASRRAKLTKIWASGGSTWFLQVLLTGLSKGQSEAVRYISDCRKVYIVTSAI